MSVRQNKSGRWIVDFYPNGRKGRQVRITLPPTVVTREEALGVEKLIKSEKKESVPVGSTLSDLAPTFYDYLKSHKAVATTRDTEAVFKNHVLKHLGRTRLTEISPMHFEIYKKARAAEGGTNRSINKEIAYVRSFFKWAAKMKLRGPLSFKTELLPYKSPKPRVLTKEAIIKLCKEADLFHRCIFLCLYQAGMRRSEALSLKWEDIYWDLKVVRVEHGKGDRERLLPMGEWLSESLRELRERSFLTTKKKGEVLGIAKSIGLKFKYGTTKDQMIDAILASNSPLLEEAKNSTGFIFVNYKTGKPLTSIRKSLQNVAETAGIKERIYPHLLRHSAATQMIADGSDIRKVQGFLGHQDITMTQRYTHIAVEMLRPDVIKMER
jgi:integrase/recombinase XerC